MEVIFNIYIYIYIYEFNVTFIVSLISLVVMVVWLNAQHGPLGEIIWNLDTLICRQL
jgi:hypothetical protein